MKRKLTSLKIGFVAVGLTSLGYWIDNDPPYEDFSVTILEFSLIALALFILISGLRFGYRLIKAN
ncbi:MAG: hypothetical protein MK086_12155 [Flavobacteriales bacterium]|nr:hypothetical protein [Flavobacteriales bacterium]